MSQVARHEAVVASWNDLPRLRELVASEYQRLRADHEQRRCATETVAGLTALMDALIEALHRAAISCAEADRGGSGCAIVAIGGYGRGELFPASDIDLMFLYDGPARGEALAVSKHVLHALWDFGYTVGHSVRRVKDCLELGRRDVTIRTALLDARWVAGDRALFDEFEGAFSRQLRKDLRGYIADKLAERETGYARYGSTVYLLEPDLKKSKGGLRDLQYVGWLARAYYRTASWKELVRRGVLTESERRDLADARDFLWTVRNELHFHAGKAGDVLTFEEQVRIAAFLGCEDGPEMLGVERFMQRYYRLSTRLHHTSDSFVRRLQRPSLWRRFVTAATAREIDGTIVVTRDVVLFPDRRRDALAARPDAVIRLFEVAQGVRRRISAKSLDAIARALSQSRDVDGDADAEYLSDPIQQRVFSLLAFPGGGRTLEIMHRVGLLERVLPEFAPAKGLMQFNQYHKFTVDAHSLRAVLAACDLAAREGRIAEVYRSIHRKDLLHLALLLHDLGKGQGGDHSEIGETLARAVADRLKFEANERQTLLLLVRQHLLMSHIAFRRDLSDDKVLVQFARRVGQPEVLKMFLVFTYADITAVGPGTWTVWKEELLWALYERVLDTLAGASASDAAVRSRVEDAVRRLVDGAYPPLWLTSQFTVMPERYLVATPPDRMARHLELVHRLAPGGVVIDARWEAEPAATELTVATFDSVIPGLFSKLSGALAALGVRILGAQVFTRLDGVVLDTFWFQDPDYVGVPPPERIAELKRTLGAVVMGSRSVEDLFARGTRLPTVRLLPHGLGSTQVEIDNESSDLYTIIDVFAADVQGLLFVITRTLFDLGVVIHSSKISTRLDQVVDVFYVQERSGQKVLAPERLDRIRRTLIEAVESYGAGGVAEMVRTVTG